MYFAFSKVHRTSLFRFFDQYFTIARRGSYSLEVSFMKVLCSDLLLLLELGPWTPAGPRPLILLFCMRRRVIEIFKKFIALWFLVEVCSGLQPLQGHAQSF